MTSRYSRNMGLFGADSQQSISETRAMIAGLGGIGSHLAQGLAYLGVTKYVLVDPDIVTESSLNRLVGAVPRDAAERTPKVDVAARQVGNIQPSAESRVFPADLWDDRVVEAAADADIIFGALDAECPRLTLTQLAADLRIPYIDSATDTDIDESGTRFGGRVQCFTGRGCLSCLDELSQKLLVEETETDSQAEERRRIYGIPRTALSSAGPSVVTLNGVVANVALTEAMCLLAGLREPRLLLHYYGHMPAIVRPDREGRRDCYYCSRWRRNSP